jgi:uncharacterized membrane protein YtjA (UPF0391 family)
VIWRGFDRFYPAGANFDTEHQFCSIGIGTFSQDWRPDPRGTFVPKADYFRRQCVMVPVALMSKQKVEIEVRVMLSWVVTFLVIALIAGILGFGGIAGASVEIAKIIFFIAVVLFLVSAVVGLARGRTRV